MPDPDKGAAGAEKAAESAAPPVTPIQELESGALPPWLRDIPSPPSRLFLRGRLPQDPVEAVAVVGSRRATALALREAFQLGKDLAESGFTVVSGLARGVDGAALAGALHGGGIGGAVLGNGFPEIYPPEHAALAERLVAGGGFLLTEYPPHTPPLRRHFPARNRLISALAQALVVVQAGLRSGSLITVGWALEQGRDVFVFPGPTDGPHYTGCHTLIREGATLITGCTDLLESLSQSTARTAASDAERIDRGLAGGAASPLELIEKTGLPASVVLRAWVRRTETG